MTRREPWADRMRRGRSNPDRPTSDVDPNQPDGSSVPQQLPPITEHPPAPVNPYRGMERHGVPDGMTPMQAAALDDDDSKWTSPTFTPPHADMEPLPVHVVNTSTDEYRAWRSMQFPVTSTVNQLVGRDRLRRKVTIYNVAGANACLGPTPDVTVKNCWFLFAGGPAFVTETTEPIYVTSFDGQPATLAVWQEYMVDPKEQNTTWSREEPHTFPHPPPAHHHHP